MSNIIQNTKLKNPIIHHITNYVTVNDCANITLAIGASPIMADSIKEVKEITNISNALVLNIGTINERTEKSMYLASKKANEENIPIILDPVGVGVSKLREDTVRYLIKNRDITVINGNISEIMAIGRISSDNKGVDSHPDLEKMDIDKLIEIAKNISLDTKSIIAMTGKTDIITDGKTVYIVKNGIKELGLVTGTGCMSASLVASLVSSNMDNKLLATATAISIMGINGELSENSFIEEGLGSFRFNIINKTSKINDKLFNEYMKVEKLNE